MTKKRKYLSGAQKRRIKRMKEELKLNLPKITAVFTLTTSETSSTDGQPTDSSTRSGDTSAINTLPDDQTHGPGRNSSGKRKRESSGPDRKSSETEVDRQILLEPQQPPHNDQAEAQPNQYPSERDSFPVDITDTNLKRAIVNRGPCQPGGPFPRDNKGRCFSTDYYWKKAKIGNKIARKWLSYSSKMDCVYCEPCWLFANRQCLTHQPSWTVGISDWQGLSNKIKKHERSRAHLAACILYDSSKNDPAIDAQLSITYKEEVHFWTKVLERITDVTLTLASCNLDFRGLHEEIGEVNNGNVLSVIELLSRYDSVLQALLSERGKDTYLSPLIQNELIDLLSENVQKQIVSEIKEADFYSVIMDTTQDLSNVYQLSQVFRYVTVHKDENDEPTSVEIKQSFLGFQNVSDQTEEGLVTSILKQIEEKGLSVHKCRGQGYDGACTMAGIYSAVQENISDKQPNAVYVHCAAHNLNSILNDACEQISEVKHYYDTLQKIYVFFSESDKRWELLEGHLNLKPPLERVCSTRWSSRNDALCALRFRYTDILQALTKITLQSKNAEERSESAGLIKSMDSFEFAVMTVIQQTIFETTNFVSKVLQDKESELLLAAKLLKNAGNALMEFRDEFNDIKATAQELVASWGVSSSFAQKSGRRTNQYFDYLCEDQRLSNPEEQFKTTVFYANIDTAVFQLKKRFQSMDDLAKRFHFLTPRHLLYASDEELVKSAESLASVYKDDLSTEFPMQILLFRNALSSEILEIENGTTTDLTNLLLVKHSSILSSLEDVGTALKLFLTLPVTVASAEISCSKLKIIKSFLRTSMIQDRLSGLATLSIENQKARQLDISAIVTGFAQKNAKRLRLKR